MYAFHDPADAPWSTVVGRSAALDVSTASMGPSAVAMYAAFLVRSSARSTMSYRSVVVLPPPSPISLCRSCTVQATLFVPRSIAVRFDFPLPSVSVSDHPSA